MVVTCDFAYIIELRKLKKIKKSHKEDKTLAKGLHANWQKFPFN
jgi:hypothetical protein